MTPFELFVAVAALCGASLGGGWYSLRSSKKSFDRLMSDRSIRIQQAEEMRLAQAKSKIVVQSKETAIRDFHRSAVGERLLDYRFGGQPFAVLHSAYEVRDGMATEVNVPPIGDLIRANAPLEQPQA